MGPRTGLRGPAGATRTFRGAPYTAKGEDTAGVFCVAILKGFTVCPESAELAVVNMPLDADAGPKEGSEVADSTVEPTTIGLNVCAELAVIIVGLSSPDSTSLSTLTSFNRLFGRGPSMGVVRSPMKEVISYCVAAEPNRGVLLSACSLGELGTSSLKTRLDGSPEDNIPRDWRLGRNTCPVPVVTGTSELTSPVGGSGNMLKENSLLAEAESILCMLNEFVDALLTRGTGLSRGSGGAVGAAAGGPSLGVGARVLACEGNAEPCGENSRNAAILLSSSVCWRRSSSKEDMLVRARAVESFEMRFAPIMPFKPYTGESAPILESPIGKLGLENDTRELCCIP
jgi:hypothetical protein